MRIRKGRKKGSKNRAQMPSSYEVGDGAVNFWFAILAQAKKDVFKCCWAKEMAESFVKYKGITLEEFLDPDYTMRNIDAVAEAWWVCDYIGG